MGPCRCRNKRNWPLKVLARVPVPVIIFLRQDACDVRGLPVIHANRNNVDVFARVFQVDGTMCQRGNIGLARERSFGEGSGGAGLFW